MVETEHHTCKKNTRELATHICSTQNVNFVRNLSVQVHYYYTNMIFFNKCRILFSRLLHPLSRVSINVVSRAIRVVDGWQYIDLFYKCLLLPGQVRISKLFTVSYNLVIEAWKIYHKWGIISEIFNFPYDLWVLSEIQKLVINKRNIF